jgi:hypothetical protein
MHNFFAPQSVMIEVLIKPSGGNTVTQTPFTEQQQLLNRPIIGIESYCATDMTNSPLSSGVAVIPVALFLGAFLNIQRAPMAGSDAGLWYKNIPLSRLRAVKNDYTALNPSASSAQGVFLVKPMSFQWPDSNVSFPTSLAQAAPYSVPFLCHYLLEHEDTHPYEMGGFNAAAIRRRGM